MVCMSEVFRARRSVEAQVLVGWERENASSIEDAIAIGRRMGLFLHMQQSPAAGHAKTLCNRQC